MWSAWFTGSYTDFFMDMYISGNIYIRRCFQIPSYVPTYKLEKCCDDHDICYGTCGKDKEKCDEKFKKCLYGICSSVKKIVDNEALDKGIFFSSKFDDSIISQVK